MEKTFTILVCHVLRMSDAELAAIVALVATESVSFNDDEIESIADALITARPAAIAALSAVESAQ